MNHYNLKAIHLMIKPHIYLTVYKIIANNNKTLIVVSLAQTQFRRPYHSWSLILLENTPGSCPTLAIKKLENELKMNSNLPIYQSF